MKKVTSQTFESAYARLNPEQKRAVDAVEGPVMVIAGPGTGKTQILTLRIANILLTTDCAPENILALTFTNSGVKAMRDRLISYIGDDAFRINIHTYHSFAENIIREFPSYFPALEFSNVIGDLEKVKIIEKILSEGVYTELVSFHDPLQVIPQIRDALDTIKAEGLDPEQFALSIPVWEEEQLNDESILYKKNYGEYKAGDIKPSERVKIEKRVAKARELATIFDAYQKEIKKQSFYDFSDMILRVLQEFEVNPEFTLDIQEKYHYLLVDEHQDTNEGQNKLIEYLTKAPHLEGHANVFAVGDEKQSIYRFQGASEKTFRHFLDMYNDVEVIHLSKNYRSYGEILDASHSLITHTIADATPLDPDRVREKGDVTVLEFSNYKFELLYVAEDIQKKIESGVDPREIAIIYRSNKTIDDLKEVLPQYKIPHSVLSKDTVLDDRNIENLISLLRVIHNPNDDYHLGKVLLIDFLHIDPYEAVRILQLFRKMNRNGEHSLFQVLQGEEHFKGLVDILKHLMTLSANLNFGSFFKEFLSEIGYMEHMLTASDSRSRLLKIETLFEEIKRQSHMRKRYTLADFITFVDAFQKYRLEIKASDITVSDGVACMTAHRSKGLEFEHVYILNATRNTWEKNAGFRKISLPIPEYRGDEHDERRLFYVAMTRAKDTLTITSSLSDWEGREREKSRFVSEIDERVTRVVDASDFENAHIDSLSLFMKVDDSRESIFDVAYLQSLFLEKNLSVTSLNNYLECATKYLFKNLIQLPSYYSPVQMFGNVVHKALERFFEQSREMKSISTKDSLVTFFVESLEDSNIYGAEFERFLVRGRDMLNDYYDEYHRIWSTNISNEKHIQRAFILPNGSKITLSGILDKIEYLDSESEGRIVIVDYKTGKPYSEKSSKRQKEDLQRQIIFYHLLMEGYNRGKFTVTRALLDFIEKNKKGSFEQHTFDVTANDIDTIKTHIVTMAEEVMSGVFLSKGCQRRECEFCALKKSMEEKE